MSTQGCRVSNRKRWEENLAFLDIRQSGACGSYTSGSDLNDMSTTADADLLVIQSANADAWRGKRTGLRTGLRNCGNHVVGVSHHIYP